MMGFGVGRLLSGRGGFEGGEALRLGSPASGPSGHLLAGGEKAGVPRLRFGLVGVVGLVGLGLVAFVGCAAPGSGEPARAPGAALVEQAALRERALSILESAAAGDEAVLRANALEGLQIVPPRALPLVRRGLQDENEGVRTVAAMVAGRAGMDRLVPELRTRRDDPSAFVRAAVIYGLRANGAEADPSPLSGMLLGSDSPRVRAHAAFVIGELGERSALPMLRQAAAASMERAEAAEVRVMRLQIAEAMVKLGDDEPLQGIRAALYPSRPEDLELTALAVQIIGSLDDRASAGQLIYLTAFKDGSRYLPPEVRLAVAQSLAKMGRTEGEFLAKEYAGHPSATVREQAAHVYGWTLEPEGVGPLVAMLEDPAGQVRVAAAAGVLRVLGER